MFCLLLIKKIEGARLEYDVSFVNNVTHESQKLNKTITYQVLDNNRDGFV